jgi:phage-related protein (TIGR01555 family)
LIYFAENKLTSLLKPAYNFFGLPLAQKVIDAVAHYTENREAAGRLLQKYAVTILKTNMEEVLSGGFDQSLKNRIQYFVQNRSNDGCAAIDKDMEDLVIQTTSLAGVTDIVRQSMEYVAAMFNEPVTKMWGLSPNGFSSGDVELQNHYDNIKAQQEKMFGEPIRRVIRVLQQNLYGEIDDSIIFNFLPLSEDDERKIAETNKIQADTDAVLITNGVISEEEARERLIADENSGYNTLTEREDDFPSFEMPEETPTEKEVVIE